MPNTTNWEQILERMPLYMYFKQERTDAYLESMESRRRPIKKNCRLAMWIEGLAKRDDDFPRSAGGLSRKIEEQPREEDCLEEMEASVDTLEMLEK
jgi:hypothetical protein